MRLKNIDFLRGIAVLLVLFRHIRLEPVFARIGWVGVDLFFVLSGFLVSNLLFLEYRQRNFVRPIHFLIRRGFKIYPLYYLMIGLLYYALQYDNVENWDNYPERLFNEVLFIQNYTYGNTLAWHTWSLAVEEHFYFVLALLIFLLAQLKLLENTHIFNALSFLIFSAALVMRFRITQNIDFQYVDYLMPTHLRMDTLWVGVTLSYYFNFHPTRFNAFFAKKQWIYLGLIAFPIAAIGLKSWILATFGLTTIAFCFGCTLAGVLANVEAERLLSQWFTGNIFTWIAKIGQNSYAIYLFHMMVLSFSTPFNTHGRLLLLTWQGWVNCFVAVTLSLIIGFAATQYIEKPILKWRDRFFPNI